MPKTAATESWASDQTRRILPLVDLELRPGGFYRVDPELVHEFRQVDHHVAYLLSDLGQLPGRQILALLLGEPLEVLDDLRGLHAQGHREVLRGVELLPVSFCGERAYRSQ